MIRTAPGFSRIESFNNQLDQPTLEPGGTGTSQGIVEYTMSKIQREFLYLHRRLGHMAFQHMQKLARLGILPKKFANVTMQRCRHCQEGAQTKRPVVELPGHIKTDCLAPGKCFSVDQIQSGIPGFVPTWKGKPTTKEYNAATVFVDHASKWIFLNLHESTGAEEAVNAKLCFERAIESCGVKAKQFRTDNGVFASKDFKNAVEALNQHVSFCGPYAHHQNGVAERAI